MFKKLVKSGFFIALGFAPAVFFNSAYAASLPPGNPFYPFQKGVWQLRRALTFNPLAKVLLEIRLVNERQIDIARLLVMHADESALMIALQAYGDELALFADQVRGVQDERVITSAAQIFINHTAFFNDIVGNAAVAANADLRLQAETIKESLVKIALGIMEKNTAAAFRARIRAAVTGADSFREFRAAEALISLEGKTVSANAVKKIEFAKDDMLAAFVGKIKRGDIVLEKMDWIQGDMLARFETLDAARSLVSDLETRNALTRARARALEQADMNRRITPVAVRERIDYAKDASEALGVSSEQKIYFIEQAEKFFGSAAYAVAFQHAVAARAAVIGLVMEKTVTKNDLREEITVLKEEYDAIKFPPAFAEKRIAALADMIGRFSTNDVLAAIREVKMMLAFSDN